MKSIQKNNVALSFMLLVSALPVFAMESSLGGAKDPSHSRRHARRQGASAREAIRLSSSQEDLRRARINYYDNSPATREQQNELEQLANHDNNATVSRFAGARAKLASLFVYLNPRSYSRPTLFTKDGLRDVGNRVVSPFQAVFMPFSDEQEVIDARIAVQKARFKEGKIRNAAVKITEFLNQHNYISNGAYCSVLLAGTYLSYKATHAAWKKACKWYNDRQAVLTLEDVLEKANRKVTGEITTPLAQAIQEDINLSARIDTLSEAKRAAVKTVIEQFDCAYTLTNVQMKNQAISDVLTALTQVCQSV